MKTIFAGACAFLLLNGSIAPAAFATYQFRRQPPWEGLAGPEWNNNPESGSKWRAVTITTASGAPLTLYCRADECGKNHAPLYDLEGPRYDEKGVQHWLASETPYQLVLLRVPERDERWWINGSWSLGKACPKRDNWLAQKFCSLFVSESEFVASKDGQGQPMPAERSFPGFMGRPVVMKHMGAGTKQTASTSAPQKPEKPASAPQAALAPDCGPSISKESCAEALDSLYKEDPVERATFEHLITSNEALRTKLAAYAELVALDKPCNKNRIATRDCSASGLPGAKAELLKQGNAEIDKAWTALLKAGDRNKNPSDKGWLKALAEKGNILAKRIHDDPGIKQEQLKVFYCTKFWQRQQPTGGGGFSGGEIRTAANIPQAIKYTEGNLEAHKQALEAQINQARDAQSWQAADDGSVVNAGGRSDDSLQSSMALLDCTGSGASSLAPAGGLTASGVTPPPPAPTTHQGEGVKHQEKGQTASAGSGDSRNLYKNVIAGTMGALTFGLFASAALPLAWVGPFALAGALIMIAVVQFSNNPPGAPSEDKK